MAITKVTKDVISDTLDLSGKTVTLPAASVTAHVSDTDLTPVRNDIATLALHSAIADNKAAYNLSNAFIDQFEDDTGIDVETDVDRASGEYMSTGESVDSNTLLLLHMNGADDGTTFTDSSSSGRTISRTSSSSTTSVTKTGTKKFGTASYYTGGTGSTANYLSWATHADFAFTGNFTFDWWMKLNDASTTHQGIFGKGDYQWMALEYDHDGDDKWATWGSSVGPSSWNLWATETDGVAETNTSDFKHYALVRDGANLYFYQGGSATIIDTSASGTLNNGGASYLLGRSQLSSRHGNFYIDEFRVSNVARWAGGASFTPPTEAYGTFSATGNYTSTTETASATVSKMGIVVLYKNAYGTAALNSGGDLIASVSANGGTNYTDVTLVAGGTFSSGINIAAVSGVSVTAGTAPKYKISFANQVSGSKETQVHGVALLY